jgi:hypothetical protein
MRKCSSSENPGFLAMCPHFSKAQFSTFDQRGEIEGAGSVLSRIALYFGPSYGKAGGKHAILGLHIKQQADSPEESCPRML